jgi:1-acyl-sn-glycerol-3-phosphate acyltransferase
MIGLYTIVLGTVSVLSSLVDRNGGVAHGCARVWSWLILATTGVTVYSQGLERLHAGKTYVFVSNHQSIYDIPIIFRTLPYELRIIAKESLGRFPFLGWHLRLAGHLLVDRRQPDREGILQSWFRLVKDGKSLIVFPEGTRSSDGRVGRFKAGSFLLAVQASVPVVPITLIGSRKIMRKGQLTVRPGCVSLIVHEPVETREGWARSIDGARGLAAAVQQTVQSAQGEAPSHPVRKHHGAAG